MIMHCNKRFYLGLSMIEMMVSMLVILVGLLGFMQMSLVMSKGGQGARSSNEAAIVLQNTIEEMSAVAWGELGSEASLPAVKGLQNGEVRTLGPLNLLSEAAGEGPFKYYQHVAICSNSTTTTVGSAPDACATVVNDTTRIAELACTASDFTANEKLIRVVIAWTERNGDCRYRHSDNLIYQ